MTDPKVEWAEDSLDTLTDELEVRRAMVRDTQDGRVFEVEFESMQQALERRVIRTFSCDTCPFTITATIEAVRESLSTSKQVTKYHTSARHEHFDCPSCNDYLVPSVDEVIKEEQQ